MKNNKSIYVLLIIIFSQTSFGNYLDLEKDMNQEFVLETKKIEIPEFPYAFNPTIVEWQGAILMCFRVGKNFPSEKNVLKNRESENEDSISDDAPHVIGDDPNGDSPDVEEYHSGDSPNIEDYPSGDFSDVENYPSGDSSDDKEYPSKDSPDVEDYPSGDIENPSDDHSSDDTSKDTKKIRSKYSPNRFGFVWLDENLNPKGKAHILEIPHQFAKYRQQDPRLLTVGNKLFIVYSDMIPAHSIPLTRRMCLGEIEYKDRKFFLKKIEYIAHFKGEKERRCEKNWVPFDFRGHLLLAYQINPHIILYPQIGQNSCETVSSSQGNVLWNWGEIRGGTPALLLQKNEYLAFFHSSTNLASVQSKGEDMQHYFMGGYVFSSMPPFALKKISPKPIIGKNYYNGHQYKTWKPLRVIFPCGFIMNEKYIWISYGRQDHEIWISKLNKQQFLKSLISVQTL